MSTWGVWCRRGDDPDYGWFRHSEGSPRRPWLIRLLPLPPVTVMHATKSCRRDLAPQAAARTRGAATQANRQHGSFAPAIAAAKPR